MWSVKPLGWYQQYQKGKINFVRYCLTAPQSRVGLNIAAGVGIIRVGRLLSTAGEVAYAVRLNSA